ncbi:MAG TPA: hypothetical protein VFT42_09345 [Solirubrobacteraceae bacterium]|nr:hypothetical protein [Solirubrobacteraceae bacterium]
MSSRARHPGSLLAAAGAGLGLLALWMPWYRVTIPDSLKSSVDALTGNGNNPFGALVHGLLRALPHSITGNGWQVMQGGDIALAIACGGVLAAIYAGEAGAAAAGGVAIATIAVVHLLNLPGPSEYVHAQYGAWAALLAGAAAAAGGWWANAPAPARRTSALPAQDPVWPGYEPPPAPLHSVAPPGR